MTEIFPFMERRLEDHKYISLRMEFIALVKLISISSRLVSKMQPSNLKLFTICKPVSSARKFRLSLRPKGAIFVLPKLTCRPDMLSNLLRVSIISLIWVIFWPLFLWNFKKRFKSSA